MSNLIYYGKSEDYEEQVKKARLCDKKDKEIERLNKLKERYQLEKEVFKDRIDKAIEYIEENKRTYENDEYCFDDMIDNVMPLLDILKGVDKE